MLCNIDLIFLGKLYTVPSDIIFYREICDFFADIFKQSMFFYNLEYATEIALDVDDSFKSYLNSLAEKIVSFMVENNMYELSVNELVENSRSYTMMKSVTNDILSLMNRIDVSADIDYSIIDSNIYNNAMSNVTGTGVRFWTSKLSSAILFSAIEVGTMQKQAHKAFNNYIGRTDDTRNTLNSHAENLKNRLLFDTYYPMMKKCFEIFTRDSFSICITLLCKNGLLNVECSKMFDYEKSSIILENAKAAIDYSDGLRQAFSLCPFNVNIYKFLIEKENWDILSFRTAKKLGLGDILSDLVWKYLEKSCNNLFSITTPSLIYSEFTGCTSDEIFSSLITGKKPIRNE